MSDAARAIEDLLAVMAQLRNPDGGCPWDLEQNFATIAPYTIEEAYEVADAIARQDHAALQDELGDLLLQVVFHAQMAREAGLFDFAAVARSISEKLRRRHPNVFADQPVATAAEQTRAWEKHKASERDGKERSELDEVPLAMPALLRAAKLGKRAARVGFDWPDVHGPRAKIAEELAELDQALAHPDDQVPLAAELGDVLFATVNLARHLGIDPEDALRACNHRFSERFRHMQRLARARGETLEKLDAGALDALWNEAKRALNEA